MKIEMGESLFYSWLRHVKECQIVQTNWKVSSQWQLSDADALEKLMAVVDKHWLTCIRCQRDSLYSFSSWEHQGHELRTADRSHR